MVIQPDGKIVVGGSAKGNSLVRTDFALVRFNPDGSIDNTFSSDGVAFARAERDQHSYLQSLVIQPDGKILAAGESSIGVQVIRFLPDRSLDTSFGGDGRIETDGASGLCRAMALQPDGKILLASDVQNRSRFGVGRLLANGEPDTSFSGDGWVTHDFANSVEHPEAISLQADGKIVVSGRAWTSLGGSQYKVDYAIMRVLSNGDFDSSFSGDGRNLIAIETETRQAASGGTVGPWHVARPDGKILLGGWYPNDSGLNMVSCLVRLDVTGELDATFSGDGIEVVLPNPNTYYSPFCRFEVQPDGKVVATLGSGLLARFIVDEDSDGDGADDPTEAAKGTNPNDRDSDDDGLEDGSELVVHRSNPMNSDSDDDGLLDGVEVNQHHTSPLLADSDSDGLGDYAEVVTYGTSPNRADSDGDGLTDPVEIQTHLTNPNIADTDNDGLSDGAEINTHGTLPKTGDTDEDGFLDGYEVLTGKLPLDPLNKPALVAEARTAIEFVFPAAIGKTYRIEDSTDLVTWASVESGIAGAGGQVQRFYSILNTSKRYFRVEEDAP